MRSVAARDRASDYFDDQAAVDYPRLLFICGCLLLMANPNWAPLSVACGVAAGAAMQTARRAARTR